MEMDDDVASSFKKIRDEIFKKSTPATPSWLALTA
jgi:hypothetical protein